MYDLRNNRMREAERRQTNVLQCLASNRDAKITFRVPAWMKQQIKASGKSEADFIIAKLGEDMYKPAEYDADAWVEEVKDL